jgi:murein DD-endopeptidase MepM/ murein hydrolase activator NlpD
VRRLLLALVLVAVGAGGAGAQYQGRPPPLPPPSGAPLAEQGRAWVEQWVREIGEPADRYDAAKLAAEAARAVQPGEPRERYFERLAVAVGSAYYGFAPVGARHDDAARYRLPYPLEEPRYCVQGVNGRFTHQGAERYAFDFAMPIGSPVLAAREGSVVRVRDAFREGGLDPRFEARANSVTILHPDGSFAVYAHLAPDVSVREGDAVKQGDPIARSGNTGYTAGPHLHLAVFTRVREAAAESVPILFGVGSPRGFVPQENQFYGGKPRQTVVLSIRSAGSPLSEQNPLRLAPGARAQLAVTMTAPGAPPLDVTKEPATRFFSPTAWSVSVGAQGEVAASPTPDYAAAIARLPPEQRPGSGDWGVVVVGYEDAAKGRFGFASVPVLVGGGAAR